MMMMTDNEGYAAPFLSIYLASDDTMTTKALSFFYLLHSIIRSRKNSINFVFASAFTLIPIYTYHFVSELKF